MDQRALGTQGLVVSEQGLGCMGMSEFYGATDDKVVTDAGFILIIFFPTFVFVMSMIQGRLDKRKQARKAAQKAHLGNTQWRGGW